MMQNLLIIISIIIILIPTILQIIWGDFIVRNKNQKRIEILTASCIVLHFAATFSTFYILPICKSNIQSSIEMLEQGCVMGYALIPLSVLILIVLFGVIVFQILSIKK